MRTFLVLLLLVLGYYISYSQCTPDSFSKPNIYPDTIKNLDTAFANQYYEMKMTAVIPKDTLVFGNRLPIDSIGLISLTGLPGSLTYVANSPSGYWKGGSSGCILIFGTPQNHENGIYPLSIMVRAYVAGAPADYPVKGYKIIVIGNSSVSKEISPSIAYLSPNPVDNEFVLSFYSFENADYLIKIVNPFGKTFLNDRGKIFCGQNNLKISSTGLASGNYLLILQLKSGVITIPFVKI